MTAKSEIVRLLELLLDGNQLKRIPRSGWLLRGVGPAETESVAEHTCGTALTALFLTELIDEEIDMARLLAMCLLHDLPETQLMDLPPSAARHLTPPASDRLRNLLCTACCQVFGLARNCTPSGQNSRRRAVSRAAWLVTLTSWR